MVFNSQEFLFFFPTVVVIYSIIPNKLRSIWLLLASYFFYMSWNVKYGALLLITTVISYVAGILLSWKKEQLTRKIIVGVSICSCLAILCGFKYLIFLIENINAIFRQVGGITYIQPLNILLPMGISFYVFQGIGYIVDVYRGTVEAEQNIITYSLFCHIFRSWLQGQLNARRIYYHR